MNTLSLGAVAAAAILLSASGVPTAADEEAGVAPLFSSRVRAVFMENAAILRDVLTNGDGTVFNGATITNEQAVDIDQRLRVFGDKYREKFLSWAKVETRREMASLLQAGWKAALPAGMKPIDSGADNR